MQYKIIAISREFGSGGRTIGKAVADELGIPCYDQEVIELMAQKSGFSTKHLAELDEQLTRHTPFTKRGERAENSAILQNALWTKQEQLIRELADGGPCVIIGRCADRILKDRDDCLRVFIHADINNRMDRIVNIYGETELAPVKRIKGKDKARKAYYEKYTGSKWADAANFQITLDSGALGIESCIKLLTLIYKG